MGPGVATVVKDRVGRHRYVVFQIEGGESLEMGEVIRALREVSHGLTERSRPWLVSYERGIGVVRCDHRDKEEVIRLVMTIRKVGMREVKVKTLGTSGTIRKALRKYARPYLGVSDSR